MMKSKVSEKEVLQLFESIKSAENNYPQDLIEARRDSFAKQAAAMVVLMKAGVSGTSTTGAGQATATTSTTTGGTATAGGMSIGTLLETMLVIAIVAEAGAAAYIYREKIARFFNPTSTPKVEQTINPNSNSSQNSVADDEPTAESTETPQAMFTTTVIVTETPVPPNFIGSTPQNNDQNGNMQVASTSAPTDSGNGLHLGLTKQPTQETKNNNSNKSKDKSR